MVIRVRWCHCIGVAVDLKTFAKLYHLIVFYLLLTLVINFQGVLEHVNISQSIFPFNFSWIIHKIEDYENAHTHAHTHTRTVILDTA